MISANGGLSAYRYTPQVTQRWPRGSEPASVWLRQNDLLRAPFPRDIEIPQDYAFTLRDTVPMHPSGITVVYVVKSLRTDAMYVGFTNNMQ